jgi:hypothetical protein
VSCLHKWNIKFVNQYDRSKFVRPVNLLWSQENYLLWSPVYFYKRTSGFKYTKFVQFPIFVRAVHEGQPIKPQIHDTFFQDPSADGGSRSDVGSFTGGSD